MRLRYIAEAAQPKQTAKQIKPTAQFLSKALNYSQRIDLTTDMENVIEGLLNNLLAPSKEQFLSFLKSYLRSGGDVNRMVDQASLYKWLTGQSKRLGYDWEKVIRALYLKDIINQTLVYPYKDFFDLGAIQDLNGRLRNSIKEIIDPQGLVEKDAEEMAFRTAVGSGVRTEAMELKNDPKIELALRCKEEFRAIIDELAALQKGIWPLLQSIKQAEMSRRDLEAFGTLSNLAGKAVRGAATEVGEIAGDTIESLRHVPDELDPRLGTSQKSRELAGSAHQQKAEEYFSNATPTAPPKPQRPLTNAQKDALAAARQVHGIS